MIPFAQIPANWRLPLFFVEFDNSQANTAQALQPTLLVGQMVTTGGNKGSAAAGVPILCNSIAQAVQLFGIASMLADMVAAYLENDGSGTVWCLPLADDGAAVAATGSINYTSAPTAAGVHCLYVAGNKVAVPVTATMTAANVATAVAAAVNAALNEFGLLLPVTAAVDGVTTTKVDFTAVNAGVVGNDIDIRVNYLGVAGQEVTPAGLAYTIVPMASGATNPSTGLNTALGNMGDQSADFIISPYTDTTSLNDIQTFLNDQTGRWSFLQQIYGHHFTALRGTSSALTTAGAARNNQHETIKGFYDSPSPCWRWACTAGANAVALRADPGRPQQTLVLNAVLPGALANRFTTTTREGLVYSGISTHTESDAGVIADEQVITTYQKNGFNQPDNSYLEVETLFQLMFLMRDLRGFVTSKWPRVKLAADGTRLAPGTVGVVTPTIVKQAIIGRYRFLCSQGLAQNADAFAAGIVVQQNPLNPNRLDVLWPGTLMDQLRIFATLAQFQLS